VCMRAQIEIYLFIPATPRSHFIPLIHALRRAVHA
jgi:hypothetical protein